ncbi:MAG: YbaB/EbfC family nucleoid-associated protein [Deferribacteraceae bacterium]|jgi:DNA-binding YbaB/EbfC family protein|nr:YbaB/EbfC family nucleoid-associated protein [Deferribacteraceae bacterium]
MNMQQIMRQAQKVQKQMEQLQEEAAHEVLEVSSGGGMVKVAMNGKQELQRIEIEDEVLSDKDVLQDLIAAAVNEAVRRTQALMQSKMQKLTGGLGLNIPGMF